MREARQTRTWQAGLMAWRLRQREFYLLMSILV